MEPQLTEWGRDRIKDYSDLIMQVKLEIEKQNCRVVSLNSLLGRYDFANLIEVMKGQ